jgi:uncharacterized membrane protein
MVSEDKYRATVISIVSVSASLVFASLSPFVGKGVDTYGAITIYWIMGIVTVIIIHAPQTNDAVTDTSCQNAQPLPQELIHSIPSWEKGQADGSQP